MASRDVQPHMRSGPHARRWAHRRLSALTVTVAALALVLTGCGSTTSPETSTTPSPTPTSASGFSIDGNWSLVQFSVGGGAVPAIPPGLTLSVEFLKGTATGNSGCNQFQYHYALTPDPALPTQAGLVLSHFSSTQVGCDPDLAAFETAYGNALTAVDTATRTGDELILSGPSSRLEYTPVQPVDNLSLAGTPWTLQSLLDGQTASSMTEGAAPAALELASDRTLTGSTGCSEFTGRYTAKAGTLAITFDRASRPLCPPALQKQDTFVRDVLAQHLQLTIDGAALTLTAPDGRGLEYRGEGPAA